MTRTWNAKRVPEGVVCWDCEEPMPSSGGLVQGWALRVDAVVAACPEHTKHMPPHPKGLDAAYVEVGSLRALEICAANR